VHHALGRAGGARGVDQGRQLVGAAHRLADQRGVVDDDLVPALVGRAHVVGAQRVAVAGQAGGHAGLHAFPAVELADEQGLGLAVLEDLGDGAGRQRGVERHRDVAGHPDRQVAHQPPGAVLRQDGDLAALGPALALQEGGHAAHLVGHLAPGVVLDLAMAHRLGQRHPAGRGRFPVVQALQCEVVGGDRCAHGARWKWTARDSDGSGSARCCVWGLFRAVTRVNPPGREGRRAPIEAEPGLRRGQ
jgi:hypothetical protein